jgi:hypothetical protein
MSSHPEIMPDFLTLEIVKSPSYSHPFSCYFHPLEKEKSHKNKTHFDANHSYTVLWDLQKLNKAAEELKLAVRATLPDEAKMSDD